MKREDFEKLHGRLPAHTTYIDLDEQPQEKTTFGWTDDMIRNQTEGQIKALIKQGETTIEHLQKSLNSEVERVNGLRQVLNRKRELVR